MFALATTNSSSGTARAGAPCALKTSSSALVVARASGLTAAVPSTSGRSTATSAARATQYSSSQEAAFGRRAAAVAAGAAATTARRGLVVARAADPSGAPEGQISAALMESMRAKIGAALETDAVRVQDVNGDGRHVEIDVTSALFEGKTAVQRQRLVYKAIWEELQEAVHAVDAMTTRAPGEP